MIPEKTLKIGGSKSIPVFNNNRLVIEFISGLDSEPIITISTLE